MSKDREPQFIGIPKSDWWPFTLYCISMLVVSMVMILILPSPINALLLAWIILGQGILVKYKAIARAYPKTVSGSIISFGMALIWPYYVGLKR